MYKEGVKIIRQNEGRQHLFKAFLICFDKCKFCGDSSRTKGHYAKVADVFQG